MFLHQHIVGFGGGAIPVSINWTDSAVSTANQTAYTFSAASLGSVVAGRRIVVATYGGSGTRSVSTMTINGVSAAVVHTATSGAETAEIWSALVPSGTTGDVVITWSGGQVGCGIGVWAITGVQATPFDTGESNASTGSDTINIPANGVAIGYRKSGGSVTHTWAGITTENFDEVVESTVRHTGAYDYYAAEQTGLSVTCTPSGSPGTPVMILASWGA